MPAQYNMLSNVRSFMKSRVILTAAELDLFTKLDQNSISAKDLAAMLNLNERALTRILKKTVIRLQRRGHLFPLGTRTRFCLRCNTPLGFGKTGTILQPQ